MIALTETTEVLQSAASIAERLTRKVSVFAVIGLIASGALAWGFYSPESSLIWNIIKCALVLLPALVICFIWRVLNQFSQAPEIVSKLSQEEGGLAQKIQTARLSKPNGIRGLIGTLRTIRDTEGLSDIVDVIGGIAILANPFFIIISFISMIILFLLILIAPFVLIF